MMDNLINWCRQYSLAILRWSIGIVFLWFGVLKLLPQTGEAEALGYRTLHWLSGNTLPQRAALIVLGLTEILIGAGLLLKKGMPLILFLLFMQLLGTMLPLLIFREACWMGVLQPTLTGHYIIKNIVFLAGGIVFTAGMPKTREPQKEGAEKIVKD